MYSLVIHLDEGGEKNILVSTLAGHAIYLFFFLYFLAMIATFITRMNRQRKHFIVYIKDYVNISMLYMNTRDLFFS